MPITNPAQKHKYNTKQSKYTKQTLNKQKEHNIAGKEI
jgi:hypothetical protein